ncbi:uncharacterized protein ACWYII_023593 [Salvelinus alpinus]
MSKLCNGHRDSLYLAEGKLAFGKNRNRQEEDARGKKRTRGIRSSTNPDPGFQYQSQHQTKHRGGTRPDLHLVRVDTSGPQSQIPTQNLQQPQFAVPVFSQSVPSTRPSTSGLQSRPQHQHGSQFPTQTPTVPHLH